MIRAILTLLNPFLIILDLFDECNSAPFFSNSGSCLFSFFPHKKAAAFPKTDQTAAVLQDSSLFVAVFAIGIFHTAFMS